MARAADQPRRVASACSASNSGVWGPSPRKILNFRPSEIVSDAILCKIQQLASETKHIIGPAAAAPATPTPTVLLDALECCPISNLKIYTVQLRTESTKI